MLTFFFQQTQKPLDVELCFQLEAHERLAVPSQHGMLFFFILFTYLFVSSLVGTDCCIVSSRSLPPLTQKIRLIYYRGLLFSFATTDGI